jgi:hypothetical protein
MQQASATPSSTPSVITRLRAQAPFLLRPQPPTRLSPLRARRDILLVYFRFAPRRRDRSLRVVEDRT